MGSPKEKSTGSAIRAFIALELPDEIKADLSRLMERLKREAPDYRWVNPATMHLTIKFLGDLEPKTFQAVAKRVEEGLEIGGPLRLKPAGLGGFGSARKARVVWVGLAGPEGETARLAQLVHELEARLEGLGIRREARGFTPHLTVGRAARAGQNRGSPPDLRRLISAQKDYGGPDWEAREVLLFESRLKPRGAIHTVRARGAIT